MNKLVTKKFILSIMMFSFLGGLFAQKEVGFKKADRLLHKIVKRKKVPGIAITVAHDGQIVWSKGFGYANLDDKKEVDPSKTIFRIASVSKPIAATGLAKMVDKKIIDLEESIYTYLPDFPKKKYDFTIKQLGGHLAGIRSYKGNEFMNNKPLSIAEGVKLFADDPLLFKPGTSYAYTSYDLNLIALAMQEVIKKPFEDYIEEEVLQPLGMLHTYPDKNQNLSDKAVFYSKAGRRSFREATHVHNFFKLAGGGYLSTSEDVVKLGNAFLKDDEFLSKSVKEQFTTSQRIGDRPTYYGVGWEATYDSNGRPCFGHVGNGLGGYSIFYVYPKNQLVISILMNCSNPQIEDKFNKVLEAIHQEFIN